MSRGCAIRLSAQDKLSDVLELTTALDRLGYWTSRETRGHLPKWLGRGENHLILCKSRGLPSSTLLWVVGGDTVEVLDKVSVREALDLLTYNEG